MPYLVGIALSLGVAVFARFVGFDRVRAFYPIRPASQDLRLPALGDGSMEWLGIKPFTEDPKVFNPAQGYVTNWNIAWSCWHAFSGIRWPRQNFETRS
jgi:acyl-homoserine lactone acylase PvdQ